MNNVSINVIPKTNSGKGVARKLRAAGNIPSVVYYQGDSTMFALNAASARKMFSNTTHETLLVELMFDNETSRHALVKDFQVHPVSGELLHLDFIEVKLDKPIQVNLKLVLKGASRGVKEGGTIRYGIRNVLVKALPEQMPTEISVDISDLGIGDAVYVRDLTVPENGEILSDSHDLAVSVTEKVIEKAVVEEETEEETVMD